MSLFVHIKSAARSNSTTETSSVSHQENNRMSTPVRMRPAPSASAAGQLSLFFAEQDIMVSPTVPDAAAATLIPTPVKLPECAPMTPSKGGCAGSPVAVRRTKASRGGHVEIATVADADPDGAKARPVNPPPEAMNDVLARLMSHMADSPKRADMCSAIRTLARVLNHPLNTIPTAPAELNALLATATPSMIGLSPARWARVRSLLRSALANCGIAMMSGRDTGGISESWLALCRTAATKRFRFGLSRFMSYCSRQGLAPHQVDLGTFESFREVLHNASLHRTPEGVYRTTVCIWNDARDTVTGWPDLVIPLATDPRRYALPWEHFPATFRADAEAFLSHTGNQDPLADDYAPSVKPSTVIMRRRQMLQLASALVAAGKAISEITALSVLVHPSNAQAALRHLLNRKKGKITPFLGQQAQLLRVIATYWTKAPKKAIKALQSYAKGVTLKGRRMGERSQNRMRQFQLPENVDAILNLPRRVLNEVQQRNTGSHQDALNVTLAVAVEILIVSALRIENVASLNIDEHLVEIQSRTACVRYIVLPADMSKTSKPYEMPLPSRTCTLLDTYLATYRPRISAGLGEMMFPGRGGNKLNTISFSKAIGAFIKRETGIDMTPQLFRQLSVKINLDERPHDIKSARLILNNTAATTLASYAGPRTEQAFRRYDEILDRRLARSIAAPVKRSISIKKVIK